MHKFYVVLCSLVLLALLVQCKKDKNKERPCIYRALFQSLVPEVYLKYMAKKGNEKGFVKIDQKKEEYELNFPFFKKEQAQVIMEEMFQDIIYSSDYEFLIKELEEKAKNAERYFDTDKGRFKNEYKNDIKNLFFSEKCNAENGDIGILKSKVMAFNDNEDAINQWKKIVVCKESGSFMLNDDMSARALEDASSTNVVEIHPILHDKETMAECED